jgi:hypothetical protein
MISRSQMNRQLYQMGGEGMQEGIGSMMGQAMMQPQVQEQEQVPQKDYAKIKQILKQLYASNPQKFQEFLMKIKDKLPPEVLQELVMAIQEEDRSMAAMGGIMSVPRARYGFGSFFSGIGDAIGSVVGGIGDAVGSVVDVVGDVASSVDLGDVATAAAFYFGGPQAAAIVNSATGGTGNKYLDMGLNLYAGGTGNKYLDMGLNLYAGGTGADGSFSFSNLSGSSFQPGPGSQPDIFGDFGTFTDVINYLPGYGTTDEQRPGGQEPVFDPNKSTEIFSDRTAKILGELVKAGTGLYTSNLAKKDQERVNRIVEEDYARKMANLQAKRDQYRTATAPVEREYTLEDVVRAPAAMGGRMRYAMGNSVRDGIMAAPQIAMQMGMPVGNPRRNQQGIAELDYRDKGGFVPPIGIKEKADDIPAMLSNNEFVFTADAVGGADPERKQDRERGAKVMYTLMKRLENGGIV